MSFPALDQTERAHSERVLASVRDAIQRAGGWIPFSEYQQRVLYEPGLGYYASGAAKFGCGGDFVTAPLVSPLFGRAVARWIAPLLAASGPGAEILELGAGNAALAQQVLEELLVMSSAPARYSILDISADLRVRQADALAAVPALQAVPVRWLDSLPGDFRGVILANEVLDALPCERFVVGAAGLLARGLRMNADGRLVEALREPSTLSHVKLPLAGSLIDCYARLSANLDSSGCRLPPGYAGEFIPALPPFLRSLSTALQSGAIVLIDYGLPRRQLYLPERGAGSLRCIRRHQAHDDPLRDPGLTDITSWVDFTAVADAAESNGLQVTAFATQMAWLLDSGLDALLAEAMQSANNSAAAVALAQGVKTLLLPGEMGEAVKMMCLTRGLAEQFGTVGTQDLRASLCD